MFIDSPVCKSNGLEIPAGQVKVNKLSSKQRVLRKRAGEPHKARLAWQAFFPPPRT
jgi:hypothetical protein